MIFPTQFATMVCTMILASAGISDVSPDASDGACTRDVSMSLTAAAHALLERACEFPILPAGTPEEFEEEQFLLRHGLIEKDVGAGGQIYYVPTKAGRKALKNPSAPLTPYAYARPECQRRLADAIGMSADTPAESLAEPHTHNLLVGPGGGKWTIPTAEEPLTANHLAILQMLDFMYPVTMTQKGIEDSLKDDLENDLSKFLLTRKTIGECLNLLRERHLIYRPHGERKGDTVTDRGKALVKTIQEKRAKNL
jgi:hypothetical protein